MERSKREKSAKATKRAAIREAIKAKRSGLESGGGSALDDYTVKDEGAVYDEVDETEYASLVEKRRQREDFVVDDDGLGYHDDGEEFFGDREGDGSKQAKQKRGANATLDESTLKKARRMNALAKENEEGGQANASSMLSFVSKTTAGDGTGKVNVTAATQRKVDLSKSLDSMLDSMETVKPAKKATKKKVKVVKKSTKKARPTFEETMGLNVEEDADAGEDMDVDDGFGANDDGDEAIHEMPSSSASPSPPKPTKRLSFSGAEATPGAEKDAAPARSRSRFAVRSNKVSKATEAALEAGKKAKQLPPAPTSSNHGAPSSSFSTNPDAIQDASTTAATTESKACSAATLASAATVNPDGSTSLSMFWLDAYEKRGTVYLFGKVKADKTASGYVSCCLVVKNNRRSMFVLPKMGSDGTRASMMDVHKEMKSVLQPSCIPLKGGASWSAKKVTRKYAFECEGVPRDETEYLKVVYPASFPSPDGSVCREGGQHFERIFGANTSTLENFIIKRKLMGPCWININSPAPNPSSVSHCKIEVLVENPKNITVTTEPPPPPPIVTMTLKMKTVVNPKTHSSEIVSICAICNRKADLESSSTPSPNDLTQISLIRPLGLAAMEHHMNGFPHDLDQEIRSVMPALKKNLNERAMLSRFMSQVQQWDPDVLIGHNAWGFDLEVLLSRATELKIPTWDRLGRLRHTKMPNKGWFSGKDYLIADVLAGRVVCDTYISSKELLRETTYSLTNLSATQLKENRVEIEPQDVPLWFNSSKTVVQLAQHTLMDTQLVQKLSIKLQILPLTRQLTNISGNCWARTMKGNRAERTDYLLLHEFHKLKFICPDKQTYENNSGGPRREKAKYLGGLVLEPKKGLYDTFILLLDFNSLYPSIIQEYNLCHTTMDWSGHHAKMMADKASSGVRRGPGGGEDEEGAGEVEEIVEDDGAQANDLPPLPEDGIETGVLPRVIKTIIGRRGIVKKMLKAKDLTNEKRKELDIRQKALKLTANSMYGCLGFSFSRFYAQPIAALITAMGRETLQRTVDIAQESVGLEVIYGDTDSIMINTNISEVEKFDAVFSLGEKVKREVNKLYKTLELEIDGVFRSMLLLKKKKYAAVTVEKGPDGKLIEDKELKGLDLVRRDWCIQSKDTGRYVLDQILSRQEKEIVVSSIHTHLEELAAKMRANELPLDKYVITKGLSKHPNDYPDSRSLPHVGVAKRMLKNKKPVNVGDHIPYVICKEPEVEAVKAEDGAPAPPKVVKSSKKSIVDRAYHPEEVVRSGGKLVIDVEWYLTQQILPPSARLCEPIDGTSNAIMAEKLGLDTRRFNQRSADSDDNVGYMPFSRLPDVERFANVDKFTVCCAACGETNEFKGIFDFDEKGNVRSGLNCPNSKCTSPALWGEPDHYTCYSRISNSLELSARQMVTKYYEGELRCDDMTCGLVTKQLSVCGASCLARGCHGKMAPTFPEKDLWTQQQYYKSLFDFEHCVKDKAVKNQDEEIGYTAKELEGRVVSEDKNLFSYLLSYVENKTDMSAYNFVRPSLFSLFFKSEVEGASASN
ncbi:hypothetical protein TrST_g14239 [Triparma strigata]|uniref:DNA polymerase n=1 Tax=Triparma strigata TaxID=1606541 RepID=A0A9W7CCF0_9STRA|nr:hypothetical protein TrST_g14239 [Triparma strigata]